MKIPNSKVIVIACAFLMVACGANPGVLKSGRPSSDATPSGPTRPVFEQDLHDIRETEYSHIYVLRRKDGAALDPEDRAHIRTHMPYVNRRVVSDEGRAVLIGSNSEIPAESMAPIYGRFAVEDYSPLGANSKP